MARKPLRPLIRSGGYYPSRKWTPLVYAGGYTTANGGGEPEPPPIEKTIIGNPIHILDALAKPAQALSVNFEPVQDLHGYDSPWPAGGGKNLLWLNNGVFKTGAFGNTTPRETTGIGTWVGISSSNYLAPNNIVSYTIGDNSLTVTATANGYGVGFECKVTAGQKYTLSWVGTNVYIGIAFYDDNGEYLSYITSGVSPKTFIVPESTANAIIVLCADGANVTGEFSNVQLEEGQTATAYSPYVNICPITGYDNVTLKQSNHNIWAFEADYNPPGYAVLVPRNTEFYLPAGTYTFSAVPNIESSSIVLGGYYADDTQITLARLNASDERQNASFTITKPLSKMYLIANKGGTISDIQLEIGSTASSYEPYNGQTVTIQLGQTVYGGTLDVTTGKLTVNWAKIVLNGTQQISRENWKPQAKSVGWIYPYDLTRNIVGTGAVLQNIKCDTLPSMPFNSLQSINGPGIALASNQTYGISVMYPNTTLTTESAINAFLAEHPIDVVYELATPIVYDLTPTQIELFAGENNIWSDGEMTLTYLADGNASDEEALNILLGGRYVNNHSEGEPTDREALDIVLGGNER